jgi:hypothetical protein
VIPPRFFSGSRSLKNSYGVFCPGGFYHTINPRYNSDGNILFGGNNAGTDALRKYVAEKPEEREVDDALSDFEPVRRAVEELVEEQFLGW